MKWSKGDVVHYGEKKLIAVVVAVDAVKRQYQLQLDSKGEVIKWADEKEVK